MNASNWVRPHGEIAERYLALQPFEVAPIEVFNPLDDTPVSEKVSKDGTRDIEATDRISRHAQSGQYRRPSAIVIRVGER